MRGNTLIRVGLLIFLGTGQVVSQTVDVASAPVLSGIRNALTVATEPVRIVCFGDSVTGVYYHTGGRRAYADMLQIALKRLYPKASLTVINAGISGHATPDALARIDNDVLKHRPHLVTVMFGLNDMTHVSIDDYVANLKSIVAKCRALDYEILLCTPNAVFDTESRPTHRLEDYVVAVRRVGVEQNVPVLDCYAAFQHVRTENEFSFALLMSDEIHPNMDGHKLFAELIAAEISGQHVSLDDVGYPEPAMPQTRSLLSENKPVKLYAMPPYDALIGPALRACNPSAQVDITPWSVEGRSLSDIEAHAKQVRGMGVDLVVIAVPAQAAADSPEQFVRSYSWIMNYSLSFGYQEWDVIAFPPSTADPHLSGDAAERDLLARRLIRAQDLGTITRPPGDDAPLAAILETWVKAQIATSSDR